MGAITDLWRSERGLIAVLLILGATVLTALGQMAVAEWRDYTLYIFGVYATAKTVTGAVQVWRSPAAASAASDTAAESRATTSVGSGG
jgi:hypothetical protein